MKRKKAGHKIYKVKKDIKITSELVDTINDLLSHLSPKNYTVDKKRVGQLLDNDYLEIYFLEESGRIVGMASLHHFETLAKKAASIEDVVVHPDHRRKGYGRKIISHMISQAQKKNIKHIDLTSRNDRPEAHKFYKRLKFKKRDTSVYRRRLMKK